ncbi:hypothetical protein QBC35DRAFT_98532 [Podospora australis]|uniref:Uncharacterized protein n=1 Tax=Podospora australis TaxID=1536484 RepID=A0AAN6WKC9_9PEZI|nr:hypothetical protein QBC35DRAFT_98532 [Podospora australis]
MQLCRRDVEVSGVAGHNERRAIHGLGGTKSNAVPQMVQNCDIILNKYVTSAFKTSPAAWASKHARLWAITNVQTSVHMTAESIMEGFPDPSGGWHRLVVQVNRFLEIPQEKKWNSQLWPFGSYFPFNHPVLVSHPRVLQDLLVAMAQALSRLATLPSPPSPTETINYPRATQSTSSSRAMTRTTAIQPKFRTLRIGLRLRCARWQP